MLLSKLADIFYPHTCAMCGGYLHSEESVVSGGQAAREVLCTTCLSKLPRTEEGLLRQNETEMVVGVHAAAYMFFEKDHPVQGLIHKMKFAGQPQIGLALGSQAAIEMQYTGFFEGIDVILPVPLHANRLRSRGYNQSEYIARGLSEITGIPLDTGHVARIKDTPQQALQNGDARRQNVANAFAVNHPEQMYHKHILVVDDLITTGETVKSCLHAMKRFRGAQFSVFALCKAR